MGRIMSKTLIQAYKEIQEIEAQVPEYPHVVWTKIFGSRFKPLITGNQICLSNDADYASVSEAREAVEYLVEQLGGTVKWKK